MSFYKEVPGCQTTLESTLKFDTKPTEGSTNPVTSDGVKGAIDGAVGDASEALQEQIDEIAEKAGSGYTPKGEATVATLNGLSGQENGWLYTMTDAGTLTDGSLAVVAGDTVAWDATNSVWYKAMDYAPRQYGTNEVHNLATTASEADLVAGNYLPIDGSAETKKLPAEDVAKRSVQDNLNRQCNTDYSKTLTNVAVTQGVAHASLSELFNDESNPLKKGTKLSITYTPSPAGILEGCGFYGLTTSNTQVWFGDFTTQNEMLLPYDLKKFGMEWTSAQSKASGTFSIGIVADTSIVTRLSNCEQSIETLNDEMKPVNADYTKTVSLSVTQNVSYSSLSLLYKDAVNPLKKGTKLTISYTPSVEGLLENAGFYGKTTSNTNVWFGNFTTQTELLLPYDLKQFGVDWSASQAKATGTSSLSVTAATSIASRLEIVEEKVDELQAGIIFKNPVFTNYSIADPAVFDGEDGWFYCFQTSVISSNVSNRKMIRSTNLVDWEECDDPISDETRAIIAGMSTATNFYGPHIIKIGEYFNLYISLQNEAMIVLRSKSPNGFYEFVGDPYVLVGPNNTPVGNSYEDAFVVLDRDGQLWLFYGSHGNIVRRKLEPDGLHVADNVETHVAGIIGEVGVDNSGEGPTLYRKGGYWWLFYARGNWMNDTYCEYVGRCETLGGTFVNKNGQSLTEAVGELVLDKTGTPYRGAAHIGDIIADRENHYFANVPSYNPNLAIGSRSLCLTEIKWGSDGWPEYHELSFGSQKRPVF